MIQRVVIFGGHIQALGLARQVAALQREVVLLVEDGWSVARYSRAVNRTIVESMGNWSLVVEELELPNKGTLLFPTNDEAVEFLCAHYEDYKDRFALGVPEPDTIALFNDKRKAYRFADVNGIHCPKCWYPDTIEEVRALSAELLYPVVVKPAVMYSFHATFGKKAFRCDDATSLITTYERIASKNYPLETILVQEFLDGGAKNLYSCGVMAADGEIRVSMQANRIRQNPMDFGNSTTYAISCFIPQIQEQTEQLLRMTRYKGIGEVEWMYDAKSRTYKFLEINTRAWKWHTISNQLHFSFIGDMIAYFENQAPTPVTLSSKVAWVERLTDWTVIAKEILHGRMKLRDVIQSYKIPHESAVWSLRDPLPGIMYIMLSPILYIKRY
ncbi:MAG: hypothetical protein IJP45_06250 [Paludibacteraceae bacterium]|nr:hypothetical protein [Paludibacteraceae bacterium]